MLTVSKLARHQSPFASASTNAVIEDSNNVFALCKHGFHGFRFVLESSERNKTQTKRLSRHQPCWGKYHSFWRVLCSNVGDVPVTPHQLQLGVWDDDGDYSDRVEKLRDGALLLKATIVAAARQP